MRAPSTLPDLAPNTLNLGLPGFDFEDLYRPRGLARLTEAFDARLREADLALFERYAAYRSSAGKSEKGPDESALLLRVAEEISGFLAKLFGVQDELAGIADHVRSEQPLFQFRKDFVTRRVFKKGAPDRPTATELPALDQRMKLLLKLGFPEADTEGDLEHAVASCVLELMRFERLFSGHSADEEAHAEAAWVSMRTALLSTADGKQAFGSTLAGATGPEAEGAQELTAIRGLLSLADRWSYARALHPKLPHWTSHRQPKALQPEHLVALTHPDPKLPEAMEGPEAHLRRRDGFKLTDTRGTTRKVLGEVDYCILCHEREKDSCSKGFVAKDPVAEGHSFKKNPLGIPMTGCPLDERISEAHQLEGKGDPLAGLAMVMLDNPMCPGTGHRICNDCMKACIYQKQEPVDIPLAETTALTDVLRLPYGFEIYGLLTRWNPLNVRRPHALPYLGKKVLVVGMGPAGYTLAHYLLNEGFAVAGIDGLKIEPLPDALTGRNGHPLRPIRDFKEIASELDQRLLVGFGGVSEYGITVRWDKNFLTLIYLTLLRRKGFSAFGGVRFGGTLTLEEAWKLGFDHIAIATGAGRPTVIGMRNNLLRGIRKASDFLMALQLTGAFKKDSLANLQVELPALVIGGGLTAIDTATELAAYYPVQVEKILSRHEKLCATLGEAKVLERLTPDEREKLETFCAHGRAVRAERKRAAEASEAPDFVRLVRGWGGVAIAYRRRLTESPAYRLNHEEVAKAFEEGIRFIEHLNPVEALDDGTGAVRAIRFERMTVEGGKLKGTGEQVELPAKTLCIAAGTAPNVTYEREYPGTFVLDSDGTHFQGFELGQEGPDGFELVPVPARKDLAAKVGFFTSYRSGTHRVSFYGDNHPTYAGNVVKAMASAKDGHAEVARLFAEDFAAQDRSEQAQAMRDRERTVWEARIREQLLATVVAVNRLTPTIVEVVVRAPLAAARFQPGQFYRLQNFESLAEVVDGTRLAMEGLALTGAWVDKEQGLLSTIVLEMGASSRLCARLKPGEPVVLMGPTGTPTEIPKGETVLLVGGGLGNAVLFSIARSLKAAGCTVIYFAGYRRQEDLFKQEEIEAGTDQIVWSVDQGEPIAPRRPQDVGFVGNVVQAMVAYAEGRLERSPVAPLSNVSRVIAIGSDRMMRAVKEARHGALREHLAKDHCAIGSINSPMQCMMKEICAQCLQRHVDPRTGKESFVFTCFNQDQPLDSVDFEHLHARLTANSVTEKLTDMWLARLLQSAR